MKIFDFVYWSIAITIFGVIMSLMLKYSSDPPCVGIVRNFQYDSYRSGWTIQTDNCPLATGYLNGVQLLSIGDKVQVNIGHTIWGYSYLGTNSFELLK
jgi:hypothetical protein